ncbi:MAG: glycosyltransferase family 2 protein [Polaromonas sp.]|nr:glycosyltransferase family 2 protein [Polaromonas sp.]
MANISILILTKNEQQDLPDCLQSVSWSDDVHVYDSGSSDDTVDIAQRFGAKVTVRTYGESKVAFGGDEAAHRNWGLQNIPFKHPWVFVIDADERMTSDLVRAVEAAIALPGDQVAFRVQRRDFFLGTWLKHVQTSPFYMRLIRPEKIRHERLINTVSIADGPVGQVAGYLDHFPFSKGMGQWIDRHNGYSRFEAQQIISNRQAGEGFSWVKAFTAKDFHLRRYHQKELFYRLPFRPLVKFLLLYVAKRGFMDGRAGFTYAMLQSIYEYFIVLKVRELEASGQRP